MPCGSLSPAIAKETLMSVTLSFDQPDPSVASLFEPFMLGSLVLRNRLVMAPMTRACSPGGPRAASG
jgi:hypothetical protein